MFKITWTWLKWACLGISLLSLIVAAMLMWQQQQQGSTVSSGEVSAARQDDAGTKVVLPWMVERKGTRVLWRLKAEHAKQGLKTMHFTHPYLELFNKNNEKITVQGEQADLDILSRDVHFQGNVHVYFRTWRLVSNTLDVQHASGDVLVPQNFIATNPTSTIKGRGLRIHHQTHDMYIKHDVWMQEGNANKPGGLP